VPVRIYSATHSRNAYSSKSYARKEIVLLEDLLLGVAALVSGVNKLKLDSSVSASKIGHGMSVCSPSEI